MSKYTQANTVGEKDIIDAYMDPMEYVYWKGKGNKLAYILNSSMGMAPFAIIWLLVDGTIIGSMIGMSSMTGGMESSILMFMIPFFAVHLLPVWIWIGSMIKAANKWKSSSYAVTDKQILIKNMSTGMCVSRYSYDKIVSVKHKKGLFDGILGVSDLQFYLIDGTHVDILDIKEAENIYPKVKQRIEETPCVRELHTINTAGQSEGHVCKDFPSDYNPYSK